MSAGVILSFKIHETGLTLFFATPFHRLYKCQCPPYNILKIPGGLGFSWSPLTPGPVNCIYFGLSHSLTPVFPFPPRSTQSWNSELVLIWCAGEIPKFYVSSRVQRILWGVEGFTFKQHSHNKIEHQIWSLKVLLPFPHPAQGSTLAYKTWLSSLIHFYFCFDLIP